jgi:hypothetical protein
MYANDYGHNNNYYQDDNRYSYDNNHPKKSSHTDIQKIQCVNSNINVNGIDITKIPRDDIAGVAAANEGGTADAANTQNGNGLADRINFNKNLVNICVNVNDNEQIKVNPPEEATLEVSKDVTCTPVHNFRQEIDACNDILDVVNPSSFDIEVTGNNPNPSQFTSSGPDDPVIVTLGAGSYIVEEVLPPFPTPPTDIIVDRMTTFGPDCTEDPNDDTRATGTIAAGESQTCNIVNGFTTFFVD